MFLCIQTCSTPKLTFEKSYEFNSLLIIYCKALFLKCFLTWLYLWTKKIEKHLDFLKIANEWNKKGKIRKSNAKHDKVREKNRNGENLTLSYMRLGLDDSSPPSHTLMDWKVHPFI
jgi:hypothetical protein